MYFTVIIILYNNYNYTFYLCSAFVRTRLNRATCRLHTINVLSNVYCTFVKNNDVVVLTDNKNVPFLLVYILFVYPIYLKQTSKVCGDSWARRLLYYNRWFIVRLIIIVFSRITLKYIRIHNVTPQRRIYNIWYSKHCVGNK